MKKNQLSGPEHTAVRVALWRACHFLYDSPPHILQDDVGVKLVAEENWQNRPDMDLQRFKRIRTSMVIRARFIEDLIAKKIAEGIDQYVILGAGLDSLAQRRKDLCEKITVYEIDQPGPQKWKESRLRDLGYGIPSWLKLVPFDFESQGSWVDQLIVAGFDISKPAVIVSTGVTLYLTKEANLANFQIVKRFAKGSIFATTYILPIQKLEAEDVPGQQMSIKRAAEAGTPFLSLFAFEEIEQLAKVAGIEKCQQISFLDLRKMYLNGRSDGLQNASGEEFLIAEI